MKIHHIIPSLLLPLFLAACGEKEAAATDTKAIETEAIAEGTKEIVETAAAQPADAVEEEAEQAAEESGQRTAPAGALIGAALGGIIGHQSGEALEGAAIGEASEDIIIETDEDEEE